MSLSRRELLGAGLAAAPAVLAPGTMARRLVDEPLALVTADKEAHVALVGLWSGRLRGRSATVAGPRSIQSARHGVAIVAHTAAGAVSILEGRPPRVRRVLRGFAEAFGPTLAYVASGEGRSVRVHALSDGRMLRSTRVPIGSYNVQRARHRVLTPSLARGTLTILDSHGRVLHEVTIASAAHDACVVD